MFTILLLLLLILLVDGLHLKSRSSLVPSAATDRTVKDLSSFPHFAKDLGVLTKIEVDTMITVPPTSITNIKDCSLVIDSAAYYADTFKDSSILITARGNWYITY
jgi:hypothetical protein